MTAIESSHAVVADTIIVVPCFNEEQRLDVARFKAFADDALNIGICFVDDGSTDGTRELLESLRAENPRVFDVAHLPVNAGKAEAVRHGMLRALSANPEYVGYWDADLSTPLEEILAFRNLLEQRRGIEMVFGSRVKLLGRRIERSEARHYFGRIFATAVSLMLHLPVYDTQCGAKLFRVTPDLPRLFDSEFRTRWFFDVELIARCLQDRGKRSGVAGAADIIYEYPLTEWIHAEASKVRLGTYLTAGFDLIDIFFHYKLYRRRRRVGFNRHEQRHNEPA